MGNKTTTFQKQDIVPYQFLHIFSGVHLTCYFEWIRGFCQRSFIVAHTFRCSVHSRGLGPSAVWWMGTGCKVGLEPRSSNAAVSLHLPKVVHKQLPPVFGAKYQMFIGLRAGWKEEGWRNMPRYSNKRHCQALQLWKGTLRYHLLSALASYGAPLMKDLFVCAVTNYKDQSKPLWT